MCLKVTVLAKEPYPSQTKSIAFSTKLPEVFHSFASSIQIQDLTFVAKHRTKFAVLDAVSKFPFFRYYNDG
jgi:hypothetical protein